MTKRFTPPTGNRINNWSLWGMEVTALGALNDDRWIFFKIFHLRTGVPNVFEIARNKIKLWSHSVFFRLTITEVTLSCST